MLGAVRLVLGANRPKVITMNIFVSYVKCVVCRATVSALARVSNLTNKVSFLADTSPQRHVRVACTVNTATSSVFSLFWPATCCAVNNVGEMSAKSDRMGLCGK